MVDFVPAISQLYYRQNEPTVPAGEQNRNYEKKICVACAKPFPVKCGRCEKCHDIQASCIPKKLHRSSRSRLEEGLQLDRLQGFGLRGDQQFASERAFGRAAAEGFFRGKARQIRIVVLHRNMADHQIPRQPIEAFRIGKYSLTA